MPTSHLICCGSYEEFGDVYVKWLPMNKVKSFLPTYGSDGICDFIYKYSFVDA